MRSALKPLTALNTTQSSPTVHTRRGSIAAPQFDGSASPDVGSPAQAYTRRSSMAGLNADDDYAEEEPDEAEAQRRQWAHRPSHIASQPALVRRGSLHSSVVEPETDTDSPTDALVRSLLLVLKSLLGFDEGAPTPKGELWELLKVAVRLPRIFKELQDLFGQLGFIEADTARVGLALTELLQRLDVLYEALQTDPETRIVIKQLESFFSSALYGTPVISLSWLDQLRSSLTERPAFQHLLLSVFESGCKLAVYSSEMRSRFIQALKLEVMQDSAFQAKTLDALLNRLDAFSLRFTSQPIYPVLEAIFDWLHSADETLCDQALAILDILNCPLPASALINDRLERHPFTRKPYSPLEAATQFQLVLGQLEAALQAPTYSSATRKLLSRFGPILAGFQGHWTWRRLKNEVGRLANLLFEDQGRRTWRIKEDLTPFAEVLRRVGAELGRFAIPSIDSSDAKGGRIELDHIVLVATDLVPKRIRWQSETAFSFGAEKQAKDAKLVLEGIDLNATNVAFAYTKSGETRESGLADVRIALNIELLFSASGASPAPTYSSSNVNVKNCNVSFKGTGKDTLYQFAFPFARSYLIGKIQDGIQGFLDDTIVPFLRIWKNLGAESYKTLADPLLANAGLRESIVPFSYQASREMFRKHVRNVIGSSDLFLDNPVEDDQTAPSSATSSRRTSDAAAPPLASAPRRQSMASFLDATSSQDVTNPRNIRTPPVSASFRDNYRRSSIAAVKAQPSPLVDMGGALGMSFEDYDNAAKSFHRERNGVHISKARRSMSSHLNAEAIADTTTADAAARPPRFGKVQPLTESPLPASPVPATATQDKPTVAPQRRKSMAEYLSDATRKDYSDPEHARVARTESFK